MGNKVYTCLQCNNECKWGRSKFNKFCNGECQHLFKWLNETIPRIERGEVKAGSHSLKRYLREKFGDQCAECGQDSTWNQKPLVLQLDHIDGDSDNSLPANIRLLCPNCHTQTETFGSKGIGNRYKKVCKRNTYLQEYKGS